MPYMKPSSHMVGQVLTQGQSTVSFQTGQHLYIVKEILHHFGTGFEAFRITRCPPIGQVSVLVELTALVIESVRLS